MAGGPRGPVRSSARLSTAGPGAEAARAEAEAAAAAAAAAEAAAAAARRRARARERAAEVEDSPRVLRDKCRRLARALRNAKHLVVYTGAGISTAADIPDYRGPRGVWTRLRRGERVGRVDVAAARPTLTHMALTALWARGTLKFVVSQNCDGLHVRAGLPRRALAELHGDMFAERCAACRRVYLRAFDTTERTARHAHGTRRLCHGCGRELADSIVHFGERGRAAWPLNWAGALRHAAAADVVLCLGSSLKVLRRYPRLWRMQRAPHRRPRLYIVNLQWTPKDAVAALKINARTDDVMAQVARRLRLRVPAYSPRRDPLLAHAVPLHPAEAHTTRRPHLRAPCPAPPSPPLPPPSSPSASDSDDELPLRRLAERLRPPPERLHPPPPQPPPRPLPDLLHAFQVSMSGGEATILLRAQHAAAPRTPSDLRRFRMPRLNGHAQAPRPSCLNGHAAPPPPFLNGHAAPRPPPFLNGHVALPPPPRLLDFKAEPPDCDAKPPEMALEAEPKREPKRECQWEPKQEPKREGGAEAACDALAAAIMARTVVLCRGTLYPGLHTILAPAPPQCAWCARELGARRCQWYGPPPPPTARRVWRRRGARALLCACCDAAPRAPDADTGGWYGKGYRKGRRRRR